MTGSCDWMIQPQRKCAMLQVLELTGWFHDSAPAKQLKQTTLMTGRFATHLTRTPHIACCECCSQYGIEGNATTCPACRPAKRYKTVDSNGKATGVCGCGVKAHLRTTKRPGPPLRRISTHAQVVCWQPDNVLTFLHRLHMFSCRCQPRTSVLVLWKMVYHRGQDMRLFPVGRRQPEGHFHQLTTLRMQQSY
jgi:hypothetical protein